jgi:CheY-like chemotaxis protein
VYNRVIVQTPLRAKRVLVVVRDPDAVRVIREFLEPFGFTVDVEPEPDESPQAADPVPLALAS